MFFLGSISEHWIWFNIQLFNFIIIVFSCIVHSIPVAHISMFKFLKCILFKWQKRTPIYNLWKYDSKLNNITRCSTFSLKSYIALRYISHTPHDLHLHRLVYALQRAKRETFQKYNKYCIRNMENAAENTKMENVKMSHHTHIKCRKIFNILMIYLMFDAMTGYGIWDTGYGIRDTILFPNVSNRSFFIYFKKFSYVR